MRGLLAACFLLAGCYQPATESCYYQCAAGAKPCPSGLECSAGMCVTPGESCTGPNIDAVVPDSVDVDAPPAACGNGTPARGEICYGTPLTFTTGNPPRDGVLADRDGDGDLDLIYIGEGAAGGFRQHVQGTAGLPTQPLAAPAYPNVQVMRAAPLDVMASSEFIAIAEDKISTLTWGAANAVLMEVNSYPRTGTVRDLLVGDVTAGARPNLVVIDQNRVEVYSYDPLLRLSLTATTPLSGSTTTNDVALGRLDADPLGDLALATNAGIGTMKADSSGTFAAYRATSVTNAVIGIEIGDVDGDMNLDIVFVANDQLGILHGMGDGTFAPAVTHPLPGAGAALEVRDLDGDNRDDIIALRTGAQRAIAILLGRSDRQFTPPEFLPLAGSSAQFSVRGSFNGDVVPDLVVTDRLAGRVYVYPSNP